MGEFAGVVRFGGIPPNGDGGPRLAQALENRNGGRVAGSTAGGATFFEIRRAGVARSHGVGQKHVFVCVARLDNRDEVRGALSAPSQASDETLLRMLFERWGAAGIARAVGAFAFAHWDGARLTLGRDCVKGCSLLYHVGAGFAVFASDLATLLAHPCVPRAINEVAFAHSMVVNWFAPGETLYREIHRVPARHVVTIDAQGARAREYWAPSLVAPPQLRRYDDFVERGRELLDQAVTAALAGRDRVAISLSGGLDSSGIAATAARLFPERRIKCYTLVPPPDRVPCVGANFYWDEGEKVRALARLYPNLEPHYLVPARDQSEKGFMEWFLWDPLSGGLVSSSWGTALARRAVSDGSRILMYGGGGNWGLTWDGEFSLVTLLVGGRIAQFLRELKACAGATGSGVARTLVREVLVKGAPDFLRSRLLSLKGARPHAVAHFSALKGTFVAEHGLVRQWREQGFGFRHGYSTWRPAELRAKRLFDGEAPAAHNRSVLNPLVPDEVLLPLCDRRLLEFCLQVPEHYYRRNGVPRAFARAVLADRLPPEILHERRFGAQDTDWFQHLTALRGQIGEEIARMEGSSTARRLIDIARLKRLYGDWPADEMEAARRETDFREVLAGAVDHGRLLRFVEGGNR